MENESRTKLPDENVSKDEVETKIEDEMSPYLHVMLENKIKESGLPEDIIKKIMNEEEQAGSENTGEKLREEAINIFKRSLIHEMVERYLPRKLKHLGVGDDIKEFHLRKHLTGQEAEELKNTKITDKEYQEMINKVFRNEGLF